MQRNMSWCLLRQNHRGIQYFVLPMRKALSCMVLQRNLAISSVEATASCIESFDQSLKSTIEQKETATGGSHKMSLLADNRPLTRTQVYRMKVKEIKDELKKRGKWDHLVVQGGQDLKRKSLMKLLLDILSDCSIEASPNDQTHHNQESPRLHDVDISNATSSQIKVGDESQECSIQINLMDRAESNNSNSIADLSTQLMDPDRTYILQSKGISHSHTEGTGIGITFLNTEENDVGQIAWKTRCYLKKSRSMYEAKYSALVIALRFAIRRFGLRHIRLQVDDALLHCQLTGVCQVEKNSLKPMYYQFLCMKDELEVIGSLSVENMSQNVKAESLFLALQALTMQTCPTAKVENETGRYTNLIDIALTIDPMGKDYEESLEHEITDDFSDDSINHTGNVNEELTDYEMTEQIPENESSLVPVADISAKEASIVPARSMSKVSIDPNRKYLLMFDGGSRGNPGIGGAGMVLFDETNEIWCGGLYLEECTNNQAEYNGILAGLQHARSLGIERIHCRGDSQLVIRQLRGLYKVKSDNLRDLYQQTKTLLETFQMVELEHVERSQNARADELANEAMDQERSFGLTEY